jgi:hypothetical protein
MQACAAGYALTYAKVKVGVIVTLTTCGLPTIPLRPTTSIFFFQLNTSGYSPYVTSSLTRGWGLSFTLAADPRHRSHSWVRVLRNSYFTVSVNLLGQVPVFISPRDRVDHLYPQALGSVFVASYDSQGYGAGIRTFLHKGFYAKAAVTSPYVTSELTASNISSIVACVSVTAAT